ncbi:YadA-like family protein [Phascolarctobacterium faecium]
MSKREIRAKRLVAAVLLAISVQMWSAPPLWAAEASVQTETSAAGESKEAKETKDAKAADSETGGEADAEEEETVVVPVIGYSTRSAAGSDYGVMPLVDTAVDGALTGVTSINGAAIYVNSTTNMIAIGTSLLDTNKYGVLLGMEATLAGNNAVVIGYKASVTAMSNGIAIGYKSSTAGMSSVAVGNATVAEGVTSVALGSGSKIYAENGTGIGRAAVVAAEHTGSVAVGSYSATTAANQVSFGTGTVTTVDGKEVVTWTNRRSLAGISSIEMDGFLTGVYSINSVFIKGNMDDYDLRYLAIGDSDTKANESFSIAIGGGVEATGEMSVAIGTEAKATANHSTAIGYEADASNVNSVAIGFGSGTTADNQVSFGQWNPMKNDWFARRSLAGIANIDMAGTISLGGTWTEYQWGRFKTNDMGELTGITKIDGAGLWIDTEKNSMLFGQSGLSDGSFYSGEGSAAFGAYAEAKDYGSAFGYGADADENGSAFGASSGAGKNGSAFGNGSRAGENGIAIGYEAESSNASNAIVLGYHTTAEGDYGIAIGDNANSGYTNGIAIGSNSTSDANNQVSFGHKVGDSGWGGDGIIYDDDLFRSLVNVADIEMHGALTGVTDIAMTGALTGLNKIDMKNGALTGVSTINGSGLAAMNEDVTNKSLAIGTGAAFTSRYSSETICKNALVIGNGTSVAGDGALAIGYYANQREGSFAGGIGSIAINGWVTDGNYNVAIGGSAETADNIVAIGYRASSDSDNGVAIGSNAYASYDSTALGYAAQSVRHNAVAIGAYSGTTEDNQVSFGHKAGDTNYADYSKFTDDLFRSLTNVADIDMHGALTGVTGIDGVTVSGTDASTGLTVGGNAVIGKTNTPFSSTGFAVDKEGAVTAKTVNGATIKGTGFNGVTLSTDGKVNGAAITSNSFNGVTLEKDASSHYKVGGVDVTKMQTDVAGKADAATTLTGYGITDAYTKTETDTAIGKKADKATTLTGYGITDAYTKTETDTAIGKKADKATTLAGYGIADAYTKTETDTAVGKKADKATTLTGYGIADAYTKTETDTAIGKKADKATTLTGYGIADAYTKTETDTAIGKKADKATTLTGYGITDAYTKTAADAKITAATADMATKTQVTADIGTAKTALESAYQAADTALGSRSAALETKTAKFNTAGDNLTGMANITSTAATLGGVGFASAGVMTGVSSIDDIAIDASRNLSNAGTYNGVTVAAAGISGTSVFNGAAITNNSFNGVTLEKGADNHYKVGGVDVSALKTTVDSISADGVGTADTAGIKRDTTGTATTTIETNTAISSSGITTNKATVSGATATTLENGKLTVGAATVQNTGFAVGSSSLNNGSLTVDGNNKLTTAGLTASKVTVGAVTVSGGKVSGLTDAALSAVSTEAVTGKQLNATNTTVAGKADKATTLTGYGITDAYTKTETTAAIDTAKTELTTAIGKKADAATTLTGYGITDAYTKTAADEKITAATADMATKTQVTADIGTAKTALESAYQAADTALSDRAAALETAATGMSYDAGKNTTTFTGGVTATVLTAGEFKVGATGFGFGNDGALTAKTVNGIEIKKDESKVMVGGIDLTALSNGDVVTDNTKGIGRNQDTATTTIETNTAISSSGITTNAVTASGTVKAGEFVEGSQKLSDKYAAKTALADYTTTTDMNTKFADYATTTAVDTKLADYAKSDSVYSKAAADTAFAKAGDVDTLKTTVGDADGGLVKDVTELQSGKADKATTLAGYGIADAYTQTEINEKIVEATKDLATSATVTDIQSGLDEVTGKTAGLSYDTASGSSKFSGSVVIGNEGAKTHTQITDDAIIFGEGTDKQVTVDASGIHVGKKAAGGIALYADADGTHIDHTSLVTGSVTADNLNGVAISGNATDGLSVGGVSIKALSERLDSLEQDGVATADMGGIKRTDVVENSGKTIIEDTTSFTKDGLKTANLEAATAALGGVNFAAGAVTGVSSINGVVFGSDGKIGGVSLSGGKVDGVDVGWLDQRVKSLEDNGTGGGGTGGGGSSANTSGIHKPDRDTTNIEGNTSITTDGIDTNKVNASDSIVVADGEKNKTVISKDGILVAEGEKNQVKINEDGIHVGKNSSVVNDTDGFITDKGLYIGVSSSSDTSTAKFSVAPNGNLSSKAGDYGFSNTSADGAKFTHSGDTAYGTGSQLDTTIQGNKVTTGRIDTDELYVDGNKVTVAGGTIGQTDAVDNHLSGTDADGNTVTNDFKTSAVNGTTQAAEKTSADGKESTKTVNNTSAGGTSVTTSRTTTDSKDNVTVKESSFGTNEKGMTLSTSNKVTDKDGKVTKDTSGTTTMTGDSISVSKTTTTTEKDADGNEKEVTKTSGTTIGSGEVTLKREDGSTIEVGSAIEGMQSDMRELDGRVSRMGVEIKEVGALSAALAGLHPQPENANSRADFAMAMGSYEGKQALAVGGFYRPDKRTMLSIGASTTSSKHMMNMGISIALDRLPEAERRAKEAAKAAGVEQETLNRVLERLAALEQDNRRLQADNEKRDVAYEKLAADYTQLKEKYIEETADRQQPEQAEAEE